MAQPRCGGGAPPMPRLLDQPPPPPARQPAPTLPHEKVSPGCLVNPTLSGMAWGSLPKPTAPSWGDPALILRTSCISVAPVPEAPPVVPGSFPLRCGRGSGDRSQRGVSFSAGVFASSSRRPVAPASWLRPQTSVFHGSYGATWPCPFQSGLGVALATGVPATWAGQGDLG